MYDKSKTTQTPWSETMTLVFLHLPDPRPNPGLQRLCYENRCPSTTEVVKIQTDQPVRSALSLLLHSAEEFSNFMLRIIQKGSASSAYLRLLISTPPKSRYVFTIYIKKNLRKNISLPDPFLWLKRPWSDVVYHYLELSVLIPSLYDSFQKTNKKHVSLVTSKSIYSKFQLRTLGK